MKRRSLGVGIFLFFCLVFLPWAQAASADQTASAIRLILDGEPLKPEVPPKLLQGRTLVPIRVVAEGFGAEVGWNPQTKTITIVHSTVDVSMEIGKRAAKVNGQEVPMDVPPMIENGRTLVPLRFVGESLGTTVGWDADTRTVSIASKRDNQVETAAELHRIEEKDGNIYIQSSSPVTPQHFLMDGPPRLVIDLPNTVIGERMRESHPFQNGMGIVKTRNVSDSSGVGEANRVEISAVEHTEIISEPRLPAEGGERPREGVESSLEMAEVSPMTEEMKSEPLPLIKEIRFSQFSLEPKTVRVVVELTGKAQYTLRENGEGYEIAFQPLPKTEGFLVILDPGHGGKDPGAKGVSGNLEKDLTLAVSKLLKEELQKYKDIQTVETRADDTYPTLQERVQLANETGADLFLSIHANSFKPQTRGTETFYFTPQSEALANVIHRHLLEATGFPDRGVKKSGFYVIKNTAMPSTLIEIGFLTNAEDNRQMLNPEFQARVAKALAEAIHEYYTSL